MNFSGSRIRQSLDRFNWRWIGLSSAFVLIALCLHVWNHPHNLQVTITATLPPGSKTTLFYAPEKKLFKNSRSIVHNNKEFKQSTHLYTIRSFISTGQIRWDPMENQGPFSIQSITASNDLNQWSIQSPNIRASSHHTHQIEGLGTDLSGEKFLSKGQDPTLEWRLPQELQDLPWSIWVKHVVSTLLLASLITALLQYLYRWLRVATQRNGKIWLARRTSEAFALMGLTFSAGHLSLQHDWWTWDKVLQANERDGIRHALPVLIQDAKVVMQRIDPNTPVSLSPQWKADYLLYYAAEEYLYPRRLVEQAPLQLSEKGSPVDPQCQPLHEHGTAVLLQCHD
jgi:hypothetical protein